MVCFFGATSESWLSYTLYSRFLLLLANPHYSCTSNVLLWRHYGGQLRSSHRNNENTAPTNKLARESLKTPQLMSPWPTSSASPWSSTKPCGFIPLLRVRRFDHALFCAHSATSFFSFTWACTLLSFRVCWRSWSWICTGYLFFSALLLVSICLFHCVWEMRPSQQEMWTNLLSVND